MNVHKLNRVLCLSVLVCFLFSCGGSRGGGMPTIWSGCVEGDSGEFVACSLVVKADRQLSISLRMRGMNPIMKDDVIVLGKNTLSDITVVFPNDDLFPGKTLLPATSGAGVEQVQFGPMTIPVEFGEIIGWRVNIKGMSISLLPE